MREGEGVGAPTPLRLDLGFRGFKEKRELFSKERRVCIILFPRSNKGNVNMVTFSIICNGCFE